MSQANFRVSTDILQRLGEELITSFDQGIVELAKNSYDADAVNCTVTLVDTERTGGKVIVSDDGDGMTVDDIRDGWLVLGRSRKASRVRTRRQRLPAGSKGLGRLGALRMGDRAMLATRPREEPGTEYLINIHWSDFAKGAVIEDTHLEIQRSASRGPQGTRIKISGLRDKVTEREVRSLARELILLSDPFDGSGGFSPALVAPEFKELEELVRRRYFEDCEFRLVAFLDQQGFTTAKVFDRAGSLLWEGDKANFPNVYKAPSAKFEMWVFLLGGASFTGRATTQAEVRKWLRQVGGVHLYHRGLRVRPYGDPGHDWLNMNLARARDPELRPSTNTAVGRMTILDVEERLLQKTDRTGFIENEAFRDLRRFGAEVLEWMHSSRLAEREAQKKEQKQEIDDRSTRAQKDLWEVINALPTADRRTVKAAAVEFESASASAHTQLREELTLYQTLASVGTTVSVFAHEIEGPATDLTVQVKAVERRIRKALASAYEECVGKQIDSVKGSAELVARFATLPLGLLRRGKRRRATLDFNHTVDAAVKLFLPYLEDARVSTRCELSDNTAYILCSVAAVEAIVSNLITNAVKAFRRQGSPLANRTLVVRTEVNDDVVRMVVFDNGPGIPEGLGDSIWLPGVTSDDDGTGLGLTIVRDTVTELGGSAEAVTKGEIGGAVFIVSLPRQLR